MTVEIATLPEIGDKIRLAENDGPCQIGDVGRVLDVLSNGKLIVLCYKDKDGKPKGPFRCTIVKWEPVKSSGKQK